MKKQNTGRRSSRGDFRKDGKSERKATFGKSDRRPASSGDRKSSNAGRSFDKPERKRYSDDKPERRRLTDDRPARKPAAEGRERGSGNRSYDKPEGKRFAEKERKPRFSSDRESRNTDMPERKSRFSGDRDHRSDERRSGGPFRKKTDDRQDYKTGRDKPFSDEPAGRERTSRTTLRDKPFKKYPDADRSESGWTTADGKPMRRRLTKDGEAGKTRRKSDDSYSKTPSERKKNFKEDDSITSNTGRKFRGKDAGESGSERSSYERKSRVDFRKTDDFDRRNSRKDKREEKGTNKSYIKSSSEDSRPFERFETKKARGENRSKKYPQERKTDENVSGDGLIRLNRFLSNAGICSRREADDYIEAGLVSVNGKIVTELGTKVSLSDDVRYNGERLKAEKNVYLLLNKPKDYITTVDDPGGRKTVMELIARACKERVYPVGRLDRNTTGILLFTNDGDLAKKLTHPSSNIRKVYHVELDKSLKKNDMQQMLEGVELEDGMAAVDDISYDSGGDKSQVGLELHSGKNRIVRRMFEQLGYEVRKLDRVMFAGLTKKDVPRGRWRMLTEVEIASLKMQTGKASKGGKRKEKNQLKLF